jgi:hypothetical protein
MRDFRDSKSMAQSLRQALAAYDLTVTHGQSLELIAKAFGDDNWNIMAARIEAARPVVEPARPDGPKTLHCSFCGKSQHEVGKLIAGPAVTICDGCVALCNDVIEHTDVSALLSADEAGGADEGDHPALAAYLAERTDAQVQAYISGAERGLGHTRNAIRRADEMIAARKAGPAMAERAADGEPWPAFLSGKSDAELADHKATLERNLANGLKVIDIVRSALARRLAP